MYDRLVNNILKLVEIRGSKKKPFIHISTTITSETKEEVEAFVKYWGSIVDSVGVGRTNLSWLTLPHIRSNVRPEILKKLEKLKKQETIRKVYRPCTEVYQKLSVDWDGLVTCCCGDFDRFMTVGDLRRDSLYNIWNKSERLKLFRRMLDLGMHRSLTLCSTCYHTYEEF